MKTTHKVIVWCVQEHNLQLTKEEYPDITAGHLTFWCYLCQLECDATYMVSMAHILSIEV